MNAFDVKMVYFAKKERESIKWSFFLNVLYWKS